MGEVKDKGQNVSLTSYRRTSLWFHVNWPSHSWNTAFSKFDLENPRSRSQLKVTKKVYHPIDSYPFRSMSIGPPIPGIQLFQNLTLKIQGQGHGWGQSLKSQHGSCIQSTHIPLVPCQLALLFLRYSIFKVWPWKSKVKVIAQGYKEGIPPYFFYILFVPCQSALAFLGYSYFKIWPWKFKVKAMREVKV